MRPIAYNGSMRLWIFITLFGLAACQSPASRTYDPEASRVASGSAVQNLTEIAWKFVPEAVTDGSVAAGTDHIYLATADAKLRAIDPSSGDVVWAAELNAASHATPAVIGTRVLVGTSSGLRAFAHDGTPDWTFETGAPVDAQPAVVASVAYFGDANGTVWAVDAVGGAEIWRAKTAGAITSRVAVRGDLVAVASADGNIYHLDRTNGEATWSWRGGARPAGLAYGDQIVVPVGTRVVALQPADGSVAWQFDVGTRVTTPPTLHGGTVFIGTAKGEVVGLEGETLVFRRQLDAAVSGPITVAGGLLYVPTAQGVTVVDDSGEVKWSFGADAPVVSAPVLHGGRLYVTDEQGSIYALR